MEQKLLDSSKYNISLLSLDSRFATTSTYNNGQFKIILPSALKNVMRIRLASIEVPLVEYCYSLAKGNTTFAVRIGSNPNFIKCNPIPDGNYNIARLTSAIQTSLQAINSNFLVNFNVTTGKLRITNSTLKFELFLESYEPSIASRPSDWGIGYNLGFREQVVTSTQDSTGIWYVEGTSSLSLQAWPYYLLQLECPDVIDSLKHPLMEDNFISAFAKILLKDNSYTVNFDDNSNLIRKEYTFLAPKQIPFFVVRLTDPYGCPVNMMKMDWSITIELTEIVNSKTYASISNTYNRQ
jgi:hypothetical protein